MADTLIETASDTLETGPWRNLKMGPSNAILKKIASKWPLRGADLWHLAAAKTLKPELPELLILTFEQKLYSAASGEAIALRLN